MKTKKKRTVFNNKLSRISEEFFKSSVIPNKEMANSSLNNIPYTLVILSSENYSQTLQPFISWKRKQGFNVIQLYTENIGNNPVQIKNHLQSLYENSERPFDYLTIITNYDDPNVIVSTSNNDLMMINIEHI